MSLFDLKVLWSAQLGHPEAYDNKHLAVGYLDSDTQPRIAVANFSGLLRIYKTSSRPFSQRDIIFQTNFQEPIVQIRIGELLPNVNSAPSLGVLFLRKLIVLSLGKSSSTSDNLISKSIEKPLPSPCFGFIPNPLIALSLNSQLHYLNPIFKLQINAGESIFSYQRSSKSNALYYMDGQQLVMMNSNMQQWRTVLGETMDIHLYTPKYSDEIVCVGTNCYWVVNQNSQIQETKHIQNQISCSKLVQSRDGYNILLGTFSQHLYIYNKGRLVWAAKCPHVPIAIDTVSIEGKKGFLVILTDAGTLDVCYLGTQMPVQKISQVNAQIDPKQIQQDIARLQKIVDKTSGGKTGKALSAPSQLRISVKKLQSGWAQNYVQNQQNLFSDNGNIRVLEVELLVETETQKVSNLQIYFDLPTNLFMPQQPLNQTVKGRQHTVKASIYALNNKFPYSQTIEVSATYTPQTKSTGASEPKQTKTTIQIPFDFQCIRNTGSKVEKSQHKVILIANKQIPKYSDFYKQFKWSAGQQPSGTICLTLSSGVQVAVVASKNSSKYKIQSQYYEALCLPLLDFISRCQKLGIQLSIQKVPLEELFIITETHFKTRRNLQALEKTLQKTTLQFRSIQKRIIAKLKQKASQLNALDVILAEVHKRLVQNCNNIQQAQQEMVAVNHQLLISIKIVCQLLFLRGKTSKQGRRTIYGILQVPSEKNVQGWGWQQQLIVNSMPLLNKKLVAGDLDNISYQKVRSVLLWLVDRTAKGQIN